MTAQRNHYEVLGVSPTANTDQIKTKYREMARMFHPDVAKDKALGQKMFTQISTAYRVLADPERRAQYDADLRAAMPQRTQPATGQHSNGTAPVNGNGNGVKPPSAAASLGGPQAMAVTRLVSDADFALMNGDNAAALEHIQSALRLDPHHAKGLSLLGDALAASGRREEAAAAYRRSLQAVPSPMIQAKLDRLGAGAIRTNTTQGSVGVPPRPTSPAKPTPPQSGGLFRKLLGKKK
jgi:curved DNA-binding protein CbpA